MENSSTNLSSLPEEESQNGETAPQSDSKLPSAFSSKPDRPPIQTSSQKYGPLDWKDYFDQEDDVRIPDSDNVFHIYKAGSEGPVVLCLHGGGYSGLSFALSASQIKERARVVALDLRGHGKSSTENDLDLSIETICNDVVAVVKTMYGDSPPAIVMVGHSMGGALAVHIAAKKVLPSLAGMVVVDVVEGTALASLIHMQKILSNRMQHFSSIDKAIEWSIKGGSLRNIDSARVSIPSTLIYDDARKCYTHRARLEETEQYWRGWYEGLSEKFLSSPVPKLLLLAGTDRLDRTLTIGQMQGKFQMVVVRHTGHAIQEDVPDEFANLILTFISRNKIGPRGVEIPGLRRPLK
ncbi:esterase/lipase/thioesterase family protein [Perilla frutescens var. hirtella]|uniref:Protein phosphatase methylesterase 1 n=1 Tax=Perilla frutescens var. hirtella TaxID=608512 RepID=A0AAD4JID8_PERFH|nr:esterase/lipase/thioesterase family protein [Perilla frutescens var. hirtella]